MARTNSGSDDFAEDDFPPTPRDEKEPMPNWKMAQLHVAQAAIAFKADEKSTPVLENIIYNLEAAITCLKHAL